MKKVLMVASVASIIKQFNMNNIKILQSLGYKVDVACNFMHGNSISDEAVAAFKETLRSQNNDYFQIDFSRNPFNMYLHYHAYRVLIELMQTNSYEFIHCHAPISSAIARLAARKKDTRVIYTAHGFQFYQGVPISSWILYYPIEWLMAHFTDILITINQEDYLLAKKHFKKTAVEYIQGVGVNTSQFNPEIFSNEELRNALNIPKDDFVLLSVGELNDNKNHKTVIEALVEIKKRRFPFVYLIAGVGRNINALQKLASKLDLQHQVRFLGYREDIPALCNLADLFVFPSHREGFGLAMVEAMAASKPVVASFNRGSRDIVIDGYNGHLFHAEDVAALSNLIIEMISNREKREKLGKNAHESSMKYEQQIIDNKMYSVYLRMKNESA